MPAAERKLRVCVIGTGAAGLCALRHLATEPAVFEFEAFEQTDHIGGTWVYNESIGVDAKNQLPIHSSMYESLRTNLPSVIMNFPDWRKMGNGEKSCISHSEVLSYLEDYTNHFDLRKYITFNTSVETVQPICSVRCTDPATLVTSSVANRRIWKIKIKNVLNRTVVEREFDAVFCCNGHFFEPNVPPIPGIQRFPGIVMHSHDYRKPHPFTGKTILVLGAASSGADIGIELTGYARHVYLSHNNPRLISALPANMTEVMGVTGVEGNRFILKDGTSLFADAFLYCTGYKYSFPFLDETCGITVDDNYVHPLYRHMINVEHPTMCFVGIPLVVVPFPMFHIQVQYFIASLKGNVRLPSKDIMLQDALCKSPLKRRAHRLADNQWEYNDGLARDGGFEPLPPFYKAGYSAWKIQRSRNLMHYKDAKFVIDDDGESVQIIPNDNTAPVMSR
ncbi:flavin-containing monooxygenase FMO GS-OX-like 4 [Neodiprion lecontei]|uniref:Flavin-containing monooxygenase n=1 Tax=Neodiprion lecontei TaxID=441921 RepID=A0A6J0BBL7_NEOLC|nr:flavin-containing monooxygenase FMO GS-OX-like 4 [Neodiprion lecontei]XP_015511103.1 flavin-containing monooxygenase FMO GS-OX-like 4 [Neodiprion lecontei]